MSSDELKPNTYAAIDLGSNSFHMLMAKPEGDSIRVIDSLRLPVRLGSGLDKHKKIKPATESRALQAIGQFAQRLKGVPRQNVRVVGTNTLRRARNADRFINEAFNLLNKRIEIISGREEARVIYEAVARGLPAPERQRLVIDIGGGSTELIIGKNYAPSIMESMNMGCVSYTNQFLTDDNISTETVKRSTVEAQLELQPLIKSYRESGWDEVVGCSGTIKAVSNALHEFELSDGQITRSGLKKLKKMMITAGSLQKLGIKSISKDRTQVFSAGAMILYAIMNALEIKSMEASQVALREGLIFELIGKSAHIDIQSQTIKNLAQRYHVDPAQAERVEALALHLFDLAKTEWKFDEPDDRNTLIRAAQIHEIGLSVAHSQYHKHGAYLLEHSDLLGFSQAEQTVLSLMVRYHRRKLDVSAFSQLSSTEQERMLKLLLILRLSVLLQRSRYTQNLDTVHVKIEKNTIVITASEQWYEAHPLTSADLTHEAKQIQSAGIELKLMELS